MDATTLKCWRTSLLLILSAETVLLAYAAWSQQRYKSIAAGSALFVWLASTPIALTVVVVLTLVALAGFLGWRGRFLWGLVALAGMKTIYEVFATVFAAHHQTFTQGGAVLLGFVLGEAYARFIGVREERDRREWLLAKWLGATGGLATFAAGYINAGAGKLIYGGLDWLDSSTIQLMVLSHTEIGTGTIKEHLGQWVGANGTLCVLLQIATIAIQLGAFTLVLRPMVRTLWATFIVAFHLGIYLASNIFFLQAMLFAAVVAFPWSWAVAAVRGQHNVDAAEIPSAEELLSREQINAGRKRWLMWAAAIVAILWLSSAEVVYADYWRALANAAKVAICNMCITPLPPVTRPVP